MNPAKMIVVGNRTIKEGVLTYEQCFALHSDADIVVNTSPVGMYPNVDFSPVDLTHFPQCQAVIDIIANPLTTKLVAQARKLGMKGITGLEMLIAQAKYAVEIFLDTKIPEEKIDEIYQNMKKSRNYKKGAVPATTCRYCSFFSDKSKLIILQWQCIFSAPRHLYALSLEQTISKYHA